MIRTYCATIALAIAMLCLASCAVTPEEAKQIRAEQNAKTDADAWYELMPHAEVYFQTSPNYAQVEMHDGLAWRDVGTTPTQKPMFLESTGRTYIFRFRLAGHRMRQVMLSLNPRQKKQTFSVTLVPGGDASDSVNAVSKEYTTLYPLPDREMNKAPAGKSWSELAPHGEVVIKSTPADATIELLRGHEWDVIGTTGSGQPIVIEATQRHYRVRVSLPGYMPVEDWIYLTGEEARRGKTYDYVLTPDMTGSAEERYALNKRR